MNYNRTYTRTENSIEGKLQLVDDNKEIASCGFLINDKGRITLGPENNILFVNSHYQQKGFGKQITSETISFAQKCAKKEALSVQEVYSSVASINKKAALILKNLGFEEIKEDPLTTGYEFLKKI